MYAVEPSYWSIRQQQQTECCNQQTNIIIVHEGKRKPYWQNFSPSLVLVASRYGIDSFCSMLDKILISLIYVDDDDAGNGKNK